jgi:hypothetical protein
MDRRYALAFFSMLLACGDDTSGTGGAGGNGGGSGTESCVSDPFSCPDGQTCWIGADQETFECLNSGQGQIGDECQNFVGQPTCTDDLVCLQLQGSTTGTCTPYCDPEDPAHGCPDDAPCVMVQLGDDIFRACQPPEGEGGGGAGGGGAPEGGAGGAGGASTGGAGGAGGG